MSGLSQAQVARRLQMSTSGYRLWEYGRRQVLVIHLPSLAAALGVPAATLMQWATS
jgi:transcriptional regulator with XRE-family HTH domain